MKKPAKKKRATRDSEKTKANILKVAYEEFASRGLHGARVESIAARTRTTKRMIYYYFAGGKARNSAKAQLYTAVLQKVYTDIYAAEGELNVEQLDPREAIRKLAEFSFDYYDTHPDFIRLVITENIHEGKHLRKVRSAANLAPTIIKKMSDVLQRGYQQNLFERQVDAIDLHLLVSSFCFFRVSNRFTFSDIFHRDLNAKSIKAGHKAMLGDIVLNYLGAKL